MLDDPEEDGFSPSTIANDTQTFTGTALDHGADLERDEADIGADLESDEAANGTGIERDEADLETSDILLPRLRTCVLCSTTTQEDDPLLDNPTRGIKFVQWGFYESTNTSLEPRGNECKYCSLTRKRMYPHVRHVTKFAEAPQLLSART
jgi:hypothetical protein